MTPAPQRDIQHAIDRAATALRNQQPRRARRLLVAALREARQLGSQDFHVAIVHNQLGKLGKHTGDFAAARRHYLLALPIVQAHPWHPDLELADLYHNLGGLEHARRRYAAGEPLARRAVQLRARRHGANATVVWLDRTAHAALLEGLGRYTESAKIYRRALPVFRRRFGTKHYEVAITLNNLGCVCAEQGRGAEAARFLRQALGLKEAEFGRQHLEVAVTLNNLATVLLDLDQRVAARALLRRAVRILELRLGRRHPNTRACQHNLAALTG